MQSEVILQRRTEMAGQGFGNIDIPRLDIERPELPMPVQVVAGAVALIGIGGALATNADNAIGASLNSYETNAIPQMSYIAAGMTIKLPKFMARCPNPHALYEQRQPVIPSVNNNVPDIGLAAETKSIRDIPTGSGFTAVYPCSRDPRGNQGVVRIKTSTASEMKNVVVNVGPLGRNESGSQMVPSIEVETPDYSVQTVNCDVNGVNLRCNIGDLPAGSERKVWFKYTSERPAATQTIRVFTNSDSPDQNQLNDFADYTKDVFAPSVFYKNNPIVGVGKTVKIKNSSCYKANIIAKSRPGVNNLVFGNTLYTSTSPNVRTYASKKRRILKLRAGMLTTDGIRQPIIFCERDIRNGKPKKFSAFLNTLNSGPVDQDFKIIGKRLVIDSLPAR